MGVWGEITVSARFAKALIEGGPQGIFGSILGKQKGTRPAGRNPPTRIAQKQHHPQGETSKFQN